MINQLLQKCRDKKPTILVIGDSMLDVYVHGTYDSCQENCPKFVEKERYRVPGGAANAAMQPHQSVCLPV